MIFEDPMEEIKKIDAEMKAEEAAKGNPNAEKEAQEKAEQEKLAADKIEADKLAAAKSDEEKAAAEKAEKEKDAENWEDIVSKRQKEKEAEEIKAKRDKAYEDEFIKKIVDVKLNGGNVEEFVKNLSTADPKNLDEKTLFVMTLPKNSEQDEVELAFEKFSELPESARKALVESKRNELIGKFEETQKSFKSNDAETIKAEYNKSMDFIHSSVKDLKGKDIDGVSVSNGIAADIFNKAEQLLHANRNNTSFNAQNALEEAKILVTHKYIKEAAFSKGEQAGREKAILEFQNPSATKTVNSTSTKVDMTKDERDVEAIEAYANQFKN